MNSFYPKENPEAQEADADAGEETSLLPKSMFGPDVKPGDRITLVVEHIYEDQVEVSTAEHEDKESPEQEAAEGETGEGVAEGMPTGMM